MSVKIWSHSIESKHEEWEKKKGVRAESAEEAERQNAFYAEEYEAKCAAIRDKK